MVDKGALLSSVFETACSDPITEAPRVYFNSNFKLFSYLSLT